MKTNLEIIIEQINEMNQTQLISLNNTYCQCCNIESEVYDNDEEFFGMFFTNPIEAVRGCFYGDYNYSHNYVRFNGYGNLESFNYFETSDLCELVEVISEYVLEHQRDFYMFDFSEIE